MSTHPASKLGSISIFILVMLGSLGGITQATTTAGGTRDFHSYAQMTAALQTIASTYPDIARLYDLGHSVQGRVLWGLKITDNPDQEEDEPEVRICGNHHGNEYMGAEMPLMLAQYLTDNYDSIPEITDLVDNREIWIIPMVNPDGHEAGSRGNANGVDLNRDYGYMWESGWGSPGPFSQPETKAMRANAMDHNYVLSLSYHTSGNIVNYVWNYKHMSVPDVAVAVQLSNDFASHNGYWVTDGYDWYQTRGDCNDFSYGCRGDLDWTIEIQDNDIPSAWNLNRDAMLGFIQSADIGLRGIITDANTGRPLDATVYVENLYWPCFTDPNVGDYHKVLLPGTYTVHYRANGYAEQTRDVTVTSGAPTVMNVQLSPGPDYYAHQVTMCSFYDPYSFPNNFQNNPTEAIAALDAPDDSCASLGVNGYIVLDMGTNITDASGAADFKVIEDESTSDGYQVYVSQQWNGPWTSLGSGNGVTEFDLHGSSLAYAGYVKIVDDGTGSPTESHPGADIDAVQNLAPQVTNQPPNIPDAPQGPTSGYTYVEYSFHAVAPVDPDGTLVYLRWFYGDNTTDWLGPYSPGQQVNTSHMWTTPWVYEVRVQAKDLNGSMSAYSAPLNITITEQPKIIITNIHGGLGLSVTAHNQGSQNLSNVPWSVSVKGGVIFIAKGTSGQIASFAAGENASVHTGLILGLGKVSITATVGDGTGLASGFLLGPFLVHVEQTLKDA